MNSKDIGWAILIILAGIGGYSLAKGLPIEAQLAIFSLYLLTVFLADGKEAKIH